VRAAGEPRAFTPRPRLPAPLSGATPPARSGSGHASFRRSELPRTAGPTATHGRRMDGARCRSCTARVTENPSSPVRNALTSRVKLPYMANSSVRRPRAASAPPPSRRESPYPQRDIDPTTALTTDPTKVDHDDMESTVTPAKATSVGVRCPDRLEACGQRGSGGDVT
jgi:hypothetical protein